MYKPRVQHVLGMANERTDDFNCWGATMFIARGSDHLEWVDNEPMSEWLMTNYEPIRRKDVKEGDIVALFSSDMRLIHTAYALGDNHYVHKLGRNVARLETLNKVLRSYARDCEKFIFLRRNQCV